MEKTLILLTGSTGFVGQAVYKELTKGDVKFRLALRNNTNDLDVHQDVFYTGPINANTYWGNAFDSVKTVIHLAGSAHNKIDNDLLHYDVNTMGTKHLATQASQSGVKRFIYVSSIGVNGLSSFDTPFTINSKTNPHSHYAKSKYEAEQCLKEIANITGLEIVIVRPTLVYGYNAPGNFGNLTRLIEKTPFLPFGLINNKRDFISVQNLAKLLITCAKHPKASGHTFLASDCETVSIKDFTNAIANSLGTSLIQFPISIGLMRLIGKLIGKSSMVEQLVGNLEVDSSNLLDVLDWTPPFTLEESMAFLKQEK
jgi:nucleoside-diphosphate-sugar epimerase